MEAMHATAETLKVTLEHMKALEDLRRTIHEIRDAKAPGPN